MATRTLQDQSALVITEHPLEPFARAWLARWTRLGATAKFSEVHDFDGETSVVQFMTGWPTYHYSPVYEDDEELIEGCADLPASVLSARRSFSSAFYDGKVRELHDLIDAVPGGMDAVRAIIEVLPELGLGRPLK